MVAKLVLMARDPVWAHAYWDVPAADAGPAEFRLFAGGDLVSAYPVLLATGNHSVTLPVADRTYTAELVRDGAVLARSLPVTAPPAAPRPSAAPVFVTRAAQQAALASALTLPSQDTRPAAGQGSVRPLVWLLGPGQAGSEARLLGFGSEMLIGAAGSEGRLLGTRPLRAPYLTARAILPPAPMVAAGDAFATAVAAGAQMGAIMDAARQLVAAMTAVGTPVAVAVLTVEVPGDVTLPVPFTPAASSPRTRAHASAPASAQPDESGLTTVSNPDGSVTVTGADGISVTLGPPSSAGPSGSTTIASLVSTPVGAATAGSFLSGAQAVGYGLLGQAAAKAGDTALAAFLGSASQFAAGLAATFGAVGGLLALLTPSPAGEPPGMLSPAASQTGAQVTLNPDGSVTVTGADGISVTLGPPSTGNQDSGDGGGYGGGAGYGGGYGGEGYGGEEASGGYGSEEGYGGGYGSGYGGGEEEGEDEDGGEEGG